MGEEGLGWGLFPAAGVSRSAGFGGLSLLLRLVMSSLFSDGGSGLAAGGGLGRSTGFAFMNTAGPAASGFSSGASDLGFGGCLGTGFRLNFFTSLAETLWPHSRPISFRRRRGLLLSSFLVSGGLSCLRGGGALGGTIGMMTPGAGGFGGKGLE